MSNKQKVTSNEHKVQPPIVTTSLATSVITLTFSGSRKKKLLKMKRKLTKIANSFFDIFYILDSLCLSTPFLR